MPPRWGLERSRASWASIRPRRWGCGRDFIFKIGDLKKRDGRNGRSRGDRTRGARPSLSSQGDQESIAGGQLKACAHEGERFASVVPRPECTKAKKNTIAASTARTWLAGIFTTRFKWQATRHPCAGTGPPGRGLSADKADRGVHRPAKGPALRSPGEDMPLSKPGSTTRCFWRAPKLLRPPSHAAIHRRLNDHPRPRPCADHGFALQAVQGL